MPTMDRVMRLATGMLLVVALATLPACSSPDGPDETGPDASGSAAPTAEEVKSEMDAEARSLLPDLVEQLGADLGGMQATFSERGGFGVWDYRASGTLTEPEGDMASVLTTARQVLTDHGFSAEVDREQLRVRGSKGHVVAIVEAALLTDDAEVSALNLSLGNAEAITDDDDYAEQAPPEDYLAYLP